MSDILGKLREKGAVGTLDAVRKRLLSPFSSNFYANPDPSAVEAFEPSSDLETLFFNKTGNQVHKWHHYLKIYERHLSQYRNTNFRMLELGVFRGGSLELWREYFGAEANIFGIDIDEACIAYDGVAGQVRIGSQADPAFLTTVVEEMGGVDVVIDDGSHDSMHIQTSFDTLFPLLEEGGVYIVEDLHCAYWPSYSGGYRWPWSFINQSKRMIDDMHHWYHNKGQAISATKNSLAGMHIYDSVIVFDKATVAPPVNSLRPVKSAAP